MSTARQSALLAEAAALMLRDKATVAAVVIAAAATAAVARLQLLQRMLYDEWRPSNKSR